MMKKFLTINCILFFITATIAAQERNNIQEEISCQEIEIKCAQGAHGNFIINNQTEYELLLNDRSSHPDCGSYQLPVIDFNKYTLLGVDSGAGGCEPPQIEHRVIRVQGKIIFESIVKQKGICKIDFGFSIWCLVDKIDDSSTIEFHPKFSFIPVNEKEKKLMEEYKKQREQIKEVEK